MRNEELFRKELDAVGSILLRINSPDGDVFAAQIYNLLMAYRGEM